MKKLMKIVLGIAVVAGLGLGAVIYLTQGLVESADAFFQAVKAKDVPGAHAQLAEAFRKSTDEAALRAFLDQSGLARFQSASWSNREVSGSRGELQGTVTTEDGGTLPIRISFVKEGGGWKIYGIQKSAPGVASGAASAPLPDRAQQVGLVRQSMGKFAAAMAAKSMAGFHASISRTWQEQFSVAQLDEAYAPLFARADLLAGLGAIDPVIDGEPKKDEDGVLVIAGHYPAEAGSVHFQHKYVDEGGAWKLLGLHVRMP